MASIVVKNKIEAWRKVKELCNQCKIDDSFTFNSAKTLRAGYNIYTCENDDNYVCDLEKRLELNIGSKSINIWIEPTNMVFYEEVKIIKASKVMEFCAIHYLFDKGSLESFYKLINNIKDGKISDDAIFIIVKDICDYSSRADFLTILNMFNAECVEHKYIEKEIKE